MSIFESAGLLNTAPTEPQPQSTSIFASAGLIDPFAPVAAVAPPPQEEKPLGILGSVFDILSRGQYASAQFFDSMINDSKATLFSSLNGAVQEAINPKNRLSFSDVIEKYSPEFAEAHPIAKGALGLIGDIALDPTTWLTFGYGAVTKLGTTGKLLSKVGTSALKEEIARQLPKAAGEFGVARELAEDVIGKMITVGNSEYLAKFKMFGVPVAKQGAIESATKTMFKYSGLPQAIEFARKVPVVRKAVEFGEWLPTVFKAHYQVPEEIVDAQRHLVAEYGKGYRRVQDSMRKLFTDYSDNEIAAVEKAHQDIYDATQKTYTGRIKQYIDAGAPDAKAQALSDIRTEAPKIADQIFGQLRLDPKLKVLSGAMRSEYQRMGKLLNEKGLVDDLIENYHPLVFDIMSDKTKLREYFNHLKNPFLPAGELRKIRTFEEARDWAAKNSVDIETDAMKLYATRALQAEKALAWENFTGQIKGMGYDLNALPKRIAEDIRFLGEGDFGAGLSDAARTGLKFWDRGLNAFRKMATVLKPSFAGKQAVSNSLQSYLALGPKAFRFFDPRSRIDAFHVLAHLSGYGDSQKFLGSKVVTNLGETITGDQAVKELFDEGVIRGTNIGSQGIERTARTLKSEIDRERFIRKTFGKEYEGLGKLFYKMGNHMNWPSVIEDTARVNLFLNARRAGMTAKEAAKKVDDALFDYSHGMSQLERRVIRRIVPFYSFQRFVIPLLGETLLKEPGRVANIGKVSRDLMASYNKLEGGEDLNQSERSVLPGWLLDQPFAKFDTDKQAMFRVLSNFNPLDVMGMIEVDAGGDINIEKTLKSLFLSQLAPLVKMPFELALNKNVFTDRAISGEKTSGRIGDVTASGVFSNMMAAIGGNIAGLPGIAAGKAVGEVLPDDVAKWLMDATGWEEGFDPKTGKRQVFINPYLSYVATSQFPILAQAIRFDRYNEGDHPFERWIDLVGGVPTTRANLKDSARFGRNADQYEITKLKREMRTAYAQGRVDKYEQARRDLQELILEFQQKWAAINTGEIRGY
jgi:hypothetical protein